MGGCGLVHLGSENTGFLMGGGSQVFLGTGGPREAAKLEGCREWGTPCGVQGFGRTDAAWSCSAGRKVRQLRPQAVLPWVSLSSELLCVPGALSITGRDAAP